MTYRELRGKLERLGCRFDRQASGSHEMWLNPTNERETPIPRQAVADDQDPAGDTIVFALYTDGRGNRDNLGTNGSQWPRRTADRRANLILGTSLLPRTRNLSSLPPVPLATCPVQPALAKLRPDGPHSRPHSIGQCHAHTARCPSQRKSRPLERGLRTTHGAVRPAGG